MAREKDGSVLLLENNDSHEEERSDERSVYLEHGRTLAVASDGVSETIEIRASSGQVELRIRMTEEGPVLQLDGVRLQVNAAEAVEMKCKKFSVDASESVEIASRGGVEVKSESEMTIESSEDVRVRGDKIWLN